jgi:hypothetical protein
MHTPLMLTSIPWQTGSGSRMAASAAEASAPASGTQTLT